MTTNPKIEKGVKMAGEYDVLISRTEWNHGNGLSNTIKQFAIELQFFEAAQACLVMHDLCKEMIEDYEQVTKVDWMQQFREYMYERNVCRYDRIFTYCKNNTTNYSIFSSSLSMHEVYINSLNRDSTNRCTKNYLLGTYRSNTVYHKRTRVKLGRLARNQSQINQRAKK